MSETIVGPAEEKRDRILTAASELFSRQDYGAVLMEDIAAHAGVAKGTVYNHFGSKDGLYREVVTTRLEHLVSVLREMCRERDDVRLNVRRVAVHVMAFMLKYPGFFRIWKREEGWVCDGPAHPWYSLRAELHALLSEQIRRGVDRGIVRPMDPDAAAACIFGAIDGAVYRNLCPSDARFADERDFLDDFVWRGLAGETGG